MYELDPFWYTFHSPFLTALIICLGVCIFIYCVYIGIILCLIYKKNQGAPNGVSNDFKVEYDNKAKNEPAEGVINDFEYDSDHHKAKKEPAENFVESTFFLKHLRALKRLQERETESEIGPEITDFLPIQFIDTDNFFEFNVI